MGWEMTMRTGVGTALGAAIVTLGLAAAGSDYPPFANVERVETLKIDIKSDITALRIGRLMEVYCMASERRNIAARRAAQEGIEMLERDYVGLNGGASLPLLPCP